MRRNIGQPQHQAASAEKGWISRIVLPFTVILTAGLFPFLAAADSGTILTQETQGPFTVTIFIPAEVSRDIASHIAVMVQNRDSGGVVMDADVVLRFVAPVGVSSDPKDLICGPGNSVPSALRVHPTVFDATHAQAENKLLYGASAVFPGEGTWRLYATVRRGSQAADIACALNVGRPPSRLVIVWPCLAIPPLAIALFACNQWLRNQRGRKLSYGFDS